MSPDVRGLKPWLGAGASLRTRSQAKPALQGGDQRGFTLIEVMVALMISSVVVLVAHQLFAAVADQGRVLLAARAALDRDANGHRWLAAAFLSLDVGTEGASGFEGRLDHAAFTTWLLTPDGWCERRTMSVARVHDRLVATVTAGQAVVLIDSVADLALDYLLEPGVDSRWVREWVSPVSAPVAVRMRVEKARCGMRDAGCVVDTLLFLIKERG